VIISITFISEDGVQDDVGSHISTANLMERLWM